MERHDTRARARTHAPNTPWYSDVDQFFLWAVRLGTRQCWWTFRTGMLVIQYFICTTLNCLHYNWSKFILTLHMFMCLTWELYSQLNTCELTADWDPQSVSLEHHSLCAHLPSSPVISYTLSMGSVLIGVWMSPSSPAKSPLRLSSRLRDIFLCRPCLSCCHRDNQTPSQKRRTIKLTYVCGYQLPASHQLHVPVSPADDRAIVWVSLPTPLSPTVANLVSSRSMSRIQKWVGSIFLNWAEEEQLLCRSWSCECVLLVCGPDCRGVHCSTA